MRVAKVIAASGIASRRAAEKIILDGKVTVNGKVINEIVTIVSRNDQVVVDGKNISKWISRDFVNGQIKLWLFNKPTGVITSHCDPQGRVTLFSLLPKGLQNLISVGRLDYNSEGLILLTNNGSLARYFELPKNSIERIYRCRVFGGTLSERNLDEIRGGVTVEGINYGAIKIVQDSDKWYRLTLKEGKNREIRRIFEHYRLKVTRLIRISYGEFNLGYINSGQLVEVPFEIVEKYKSRL
jgi:23S rRNA pseudouridine2605 synthase